MILRSDERVWRRREPERGVLHRVLLAHLETFVARSREHGRCLPRFVERELYRYMSCGLLAFGFARLASAATPDACASTRCPHSPRRSNSRRSSWAQLPQRVFAFDVLHCKHCGGRRKLIALITNGVVVRKILDHLGLPTGPPILARARASPELASDA